MRQYIAGHRAQQPRAARLRRRTPSATSPTPLLLRRPRHPARRRLPLDGRRPRLLRQPRVPLPADRRLDRRRCSTSAASAAGSSSTSAAPGSTTPARSFAFWNSDEGRLEDAVSAYGCGVTVQLRRARPELGLRPALGLQGLDSTDGFRTSFWIGTRSEARRVTRSRAELERRAGRAGGAARDRSRARRARSTCGACSRSRSTKAEEFCAPRRARSGSSTRQRASSSSASCAAAPRRRSTTCACRSGRASSARVAASGRAELINDVRQRPALARRHERTASTPGRSSPCR